MGGARNLKVREQRGHRPRHRGNKFFCVWAKYRPYSVVCMEKNVAGCRGRALGQGPKGGGLRRSEAETLLAFGRAMEPANLPAFNT